MEIGKFNDYWLENDCYSWQSNPLSGNDNVAECPVWGKCFKFRTKWYDLGRNLYFFGIIFLNLTKYFDVFYHTGSFWAETFVYLENLFLFCLFSFVPFDLYFHFKFGFKFRVLPAYIIVGFHSRGFGLPSEENHQDSTKIHQKWLNLLEQNIHYHLSYGHK